ncbi:MAG: hypothetical protein V8R14_08385 [Clostridia bacterium]
MPQIRGENLKNQVSTGEEQTVNLYQNACDSSYANDNGEKNTTTDGRIFETNASGAAAVQTPGSAAVTAPEVPVVKVREQGEQVEIKSLLSEMREERQDTEQRDREMTPKNLTAETSTSASCTIWVRFSTRISWRATTMIFI